MSHCIFFLDYRGVNSLVLVDAFLGWDWHCGVLYVLRRVALFLVGGNLLRVGQLFKCYKSN